MTTHNPHATSSLVDDYEFGPNEQPVLPGSPHAPRHTTSRRVTYALMAVLMGITASLGNALVLVNVSNIAGSMGLTVTEASWLPAMYVAFGCTANLLLVRARIQFGIQPVTYLLLSGYILTALAQIAFPGFGTALVIRAMSGLMSSGLLALAIFNAVQVCPPNMRPVGLLVGVSISPLSTPLARLFPLDMLTAHAWGGLHLIELGLGLVALAAFAMFPLPPSKRSPAFELLDGVTIALFLPAIVLLSGVLSEGRLMWWTDTPWIGVALAGAVVLLGAVLAIELNRKSPLLEVKWLVTEDIFRFILVAFLVRLALAEQTYGAVGLLTAGGLTDDQLHILFGIVLAAMVAGTTIAAVTLSLPKLRHQVLAATLFIAAGSFIDSTSSSLTRPEQLYLSQALIAFGAALSFGPGLLVGFVHVLQKGPKYFVSVIVMFNLTQNLGGLAGSALLGSYQTVAADAHLQSIYSHLASDDPSVAARAQGGVAALNQVAVREANFGAYDDVFRFVALLAALTALFITYSIALNFVKARQAARQLETAGVNA